MPRTRAELDAWCAEVAFDMIGTAKTRRAEIFGNESPTQLDAVARDYVRDSGSRHPRIRKLTKASAGWRPTSDERMAILQIRTNEAEQALRNT